MTAVAMVRVVAHGTPTPLGSLAARTFGAAEPVGEVSLGRSNSAKHDSPGLQSEAVAERAAESAQKAG